MKGIRIIPAVVVLLALIVAAPISTSGSRADGPEVATALGKITSIDYDEKSFVIDVKKSNRLVDQDPLTVLVPESAIIKECLGGGVSVPIEFGEIELGDWVRLDGAMDGDELIARRISVNPDKLTDP